MNIECIRRYGDRIMSDIIKPPLYIHIVAVIDKVLEMIGIPTFATLTKQNHCFAYEDSAFRLGLILVD